MALLGPLFLLGLLGIGLPIWLHRLETQVTEREQFSTTMFLEPARKRIHVQRKLKYLLLMALRILFFLILVLAFARPVLFSPPQALITEDTTHHVIVLDTSFSMQAGDSFATALQRVQDIINGLGDDEVASLYTASSGITTVATATPDGAILIQALSGLAPDNGKLDLGTMVTSMNTLIEASQANFVLHFISDFQQTGQAVRFADMIPDVINGRPVLLELERVQTNNAANWMVDSVLVSNRNAVEAGIRGFATNEDSSERTITLSINNMLQQEQQVTLNGGGLSFINFDNVVFEEGDNRIDIRLLPNDSLAGDDIRHTVFDNSPPAPVLLLTENPQSLGVTYISAALETAPRGYEVITQTLADLDARVLQRYPWIVIEDIGAINASLATAITDYVSGGGAVLAAAGESSLGLDSVPVLDLAVGSNPIRRENRNPITMIDNSHPALSETSGWGSVNMQTLPVSLNGDERVLIAQADNRPVLLESNIGRGRIMLLTTALDNTLSDLPVKPVFVSFMAEAARYLSNENLLIREQIAESFLQLSLAGGSSGQVYDPDGVSLLSLSDTTQAQDIPLNKTGYYQVFSSGGEVLVAVNPDQRESDLTIMDAQVLQNWQNVVAGTANSGEQALNSESGVADEDLEENEIWRIFLILLALIVIAESLLGNQHLRIRTGTL
ncbi:MAG: VWA domain-containing protein [Gammaproteobacteria bacterium]|nr:VWA domain-containing protein [Gammaproteobacteria bacterium]MBT6043833.1 VWA domain-containing protein [Gammaproteobacteria bacterium]